MYFPAKWLSFKMWVLILFGVGIFVIHGNASDFALQCDSSPDDCVCSHDFSEDFTTNDSAMIWFLGPDMCENRTYSMNKTDVGQVLGKISKTGNILGYYAKLITADKSEEGYIFSRFVINQLKRQDGKKGLQVTISMKQPDMNSNANFVYLVKEAENSDPPIENFFSAISTALERQGSPDISLNLKSLLSSGTTFTLHTSCKGGGNTKFYVSRRLVKLAKSEMDKLSDLLKNTVEITSANNTKVEEGLTNFNVRFDCEAKREFSQASQILKFSTIAFGLLIIAIIIT